MKKTLAILLTTTLAGNAGTSLALPAARNVYSQDAQASNSRGIDLKVWKGYGLTINFIPTGETIKQVWLGNPSRFALSSNGNLCQRGSSNNEENCGIGGATVLFIRQIKPISFPSLTASEDGSTIITILTTGQEGQKHYQFKLTPAEGNPAYTSLIIKPDSDRPRTILVQKPQNIVNSQVAQNNRREIKFETKNTEITQHHNGRNQQVSNSSNTIPKPKVSGISINRNQNSIQKYTNSYTVQNTEIKEESNTVGTNSLQIGTSTKRNDANAVAYGLGVAVNKGVLKLRSKEWSKAQDTIRLLRRGKTRVEAVKLSGISQELFDKLIQWGQN